jgi:hypothetical protein
MRIATNPASSRAPDAYSMVTENQNRRMTVNAAVANTVNPPMTMND